MPASSILSTFCIVLTSFIVGLIFLPHLARKMLLRKYRQITERDPELEKMSELGMIPYLDKHVRACREPIPCPWRILSACVSACAACVLASWSAHAILAVYSWLVICFCIVLSLIDAKARILPYEMTAALIPIGICLQTLLIYEGIATIIQTLAGTALYCLILLGTAGIVQVVTKRPALGQGDIRATPGFAMLCAASPFEALAATTVSMGISFIIFRIKRIESLADSAPFGPFLAIGAAVALIICATAPV